MQHEGRKLSTHFDRAMKTRFLQSDRTIVGDGATSFQLARYDLHDSGVNHPTDLLT